MAVYSGLGPTAAFAPTDDFPHDFAGKGVVVLAVFFI